MKTNRIAKAISRYNSMPHRYIGRIEFAPSTQADFIIYGTIGARMFLLYTLKEAIEKYNEMARAALKAGVAK